VTTPPPAATPDGSAAAPPPGCPAHGMSPEGIRRLYGPEAEANPRGLYEQLRQQHGAVAPVLLHGDHPAWLVLGHRENLEVMRTPSLFSRDSRRWTPFVQEKVAADSPLIPMVGWQPLCVFADGDEHARLRAAVTESLGQFNRQGVRRYVTRYTKQLVATFEATGQADLIRDYAERLPMLVMTQLMGMPEEGGPRLVEATLDLMKGTETALASNEYVTETLRKHVKRKSKKPGRDLTSQLLGHESDLDEDEVVEHLRLILVAANETTVNLIANTLRLLLTDRRFRVSLSGGQMTLPDALEQVLWDAPPLSVIPGRWATGDTKLAGKQIRAGDMLLLGLAAGNVDPDIRPDLSAPVHGNRSHLSFSSGPHECPGQDIGRAIADTGIDTLLTLLPGLELAVPASELKTSAAWLSERVYSLPVTFKPQSSSGTGQRVAAAAPPKSQPLPDTAPVSTPIGELAPLPAAADRRWWSSWVFWR
jgi:cytochrome P450